MILELDSRAWLDFIESTRDATVFHHPSWSRVIAETYGLRAFMVAIRDEASGRIGAGAPMVEVLTLLGRRRWVCLPFTDACGPISHDDPSRRALDAELQRLRISWHISELEIRAAVEGAQTHAREIGVIHRLCLEADAEAVFRRFTQAQVRRNVRRAEREGVVVRHGTSAEDMASYYELHVRTRRRQGVPVQPRRFFQHLARHVVGAGLGFVSIASSHGTPIAGAVFLAWNGTCVYKFGASDPEHLRLRPNHMIFWEAIRWACDHGYHTLDFGRTDPSNQGPRDFKSAWGAEETALSYTTMRATPAGASHGRLAAAGRPLIQRSPLWVCRGLGELLYQFTA